jgi:hypothetical protein
MCIDSSSPTSARHCPSLCDQSWAHHLFGRMDLGDLRRGRRFQKIAADALRAPGASIPRRAQTWAACKATYRLLENEKVTAALILAAQREACSERVRGQKLVLVAQDTSALNFSNRPATAGLGPIGNGRQRPFGLLAHVSLAMTPAGRPWGVLDAHIWARRPEEHGRNHARNRRALAQKESQRWVDGVGAVVALARQHPQTRFISIADREGDIFEVLAQGLAAPNAHVLVRAQHDRALEGPQPSLFAALQAQESAALHTVTTPRRPGQKSRDARLTVRWTEVTLPAPLLKAGQAPVRLWAMEAREMDAPAGVEAIHWRLLSTCPVTSAQEAVEQVGWYARRWQIEVFFRTLKTGCKVEERQLQEARALGAALALDMAVACRVLELTLAGREDPERPAAQALTPVECALVAGLHPVVPVEKLTLQMARRRIAQLGGFLARKSDGEPGPITLWHGLQTLRSMVRGYSMASTCG